MKTWTIIFNLTKGKFFYPFFLLPFFLWNCGSSDQKVSSSPPAASQKTNLLPYHFILGNELFSFQSFDKAIEEYEKVLELDPNYSPAVQSLANSYLKLKNHKQAIKHWKKLLTLVKDEKQKTDIYFNLGIASFENKEKESALFYTFKALQLSIQYGNLKINFYAKDNLKAFKGFYNLTDAEIIDIVKSFKET